MAQLPELALRLVAVAQRAVLVQLVRGALELGDRTLLLTGSGKRAPGQRARERGLDRYPGLARSDGRCERCLGGECRLALQQDGGPRAQRHRDRHPEWHGLGPGLGARGSALRLFAAAEREPATRQQIEALRPPAPGNANQLLAAGRADEHIDGCPRLAGCQRAPPRERRRHTPRRAHDPVRAATPCSRSPSRAQARHRRPEAPCASGSADSRRAPARDPTDAPPRRPGRAARPTRRAGRASGQPTPASGTARARCHSARWRGRSAARAPRAQPPPRNDPGRALPRRDLRPHRAAARAPRPAGRRPAPQPRHAGDRPPERARRTRPRARGRRPRPPPVADRRAERRRRGRARPTRAWPRTRRDRARRPRARS